MFDDLELRLRQQREELRRRQNERRQRQFASLLENSSSKQQQDATDTTTQVKSTTASSSVANTAQSISSGALEPLSSSVDKQRASVVPPVASTPQKPSSVELSTRIGRNHPDYSLPSREVGLLLWKTSPSSSVSMSQSPQQQLLSNNNHRYLTTSTRDPKKQESKTNNNMTDSDSSEEEIDLVAIAHAIAAANEKKDNNNNKELSETSKPIDTTPHDEQPPAKSPGKQRLDSMDDDEYDNKSELLLKKNLQKSPSFDMKEDPPTRTNPPPSSPPQQQRIVRNPLVAAKREEAEVAVQFLTRTGPKKPTEAVTRKEDAALWSDSEPDDIVPETSPSSNKKKPKKRVPTEPNIPKKRKKLSSASDDETNMPQSIPAITRNVDELQKELKPNFSHPKFGPFEFQPLVLGSIDGDDHIYEVPASISRYLPDHQREGIEFLFHQAIAKRRGAILGDDMGLGKTIQTIALLAALYKKTGTGKDMYEVNQRKKTIEAVLAQNEAKRDELFLQGFLARDDKMEQLPRVCTKWCPVLIAAPNTVVQNWVDDFATWSHFALDVYRGKNREISLENVKNGIIEVLVCGHSMIQSKDHIDKLKSVNWKMVIVDEFHKFKNDDGMLATHLRHLRDNLGCLIIGLTGTIMQNDHDELWTAVDITNPGFFGSLNDFNHYFSIPIKLSRTIDGDPIAYQIGEERSEELSRKLNEIFLRRTKDILSNELPEKEERIVFCEPSQLQKELYQNILELPDFVLLKHSQAPCDCGVNRKFFLEYKQLRTDEEKIRYSRLHKKDIVKRGQCCYQYPLDKNGNIDSRAILWRQRHDDKKDGCANCPNCIFFSAFHVVHKLTSHVALLQLDASYHPEQFPLGSKKRENAEKALDRAKTFFPAHLLSRIPGGYIRSSSIMDNHFVLSGKMRELHKLLVAIRKQFGRVLLFSFSTQMLDLIELYMKSHGHTFLRMDGQTNVKTRTELVNRFKKDPNIFAFLLSTKAMGVGLNLVEANYVIIYDVDWNPSNDSQAQDRAYRIGQEKDVKVFRLVTRGTIEELKYLHQVYKTQLEKQTIIDGNDEGRKRGIRVFRGVKNDPDRKGELYGIANLLKFKDGTFMTYKPKKSESSRYGVGVHDTKDFVEQVNNLSNEQVEEIGDDRNMFEDLAKCYEKAPRAERNDVDENEFDVHLGGESQAILDICDGIHARTGKNEAATAGTEEQEIDESNVSPDDRSAETGSNARPKQGHNHGIVFYPAKVETQSENDETSQPNTPGATGNPTFKVESAIANFQVRTMAMPMQEDYDKIETQSPTQHSQTQSQTQTPFRSVVAASNCTKTSYSVLSLDKNVESDDSQGFMTKLPSNLNPTPFGQKHYAVDGKMQSLISSGRAVKRTSEQRNTKVVGKTTNKIQSGKAGDTTFSAFDLPIPGLQMKRKEESHKTT